MLMMAILIRLTLSDGTVIECEPTGIEYALDARMISIDGCDDGIFSSGFEEV